ncbi:Selenide, water dikinase [uncultured delta proteobacterium]|uniref:Selenide, water dikinase n=1 Tax=uncultured delta proteobacterium TaxID=34034 RepID=A0A212JBK9_9DELT|nr:Selenide, water dikinase [uncultured delta proteobacterium]
MENTAPVPAPIRLMDKSVAAGCAAKIPPDVLAGLLDLLPADPLAPGRLLTATRANEDAAVIRVPPGKALVQTVDFFTPVVNDPFAFGQIAAANALSDVYAMGGEPWSVMNIVCFPVRDYPASVLAGILAGGAAKAAEAGAVLAGGHSVNDTEIKYGMAVTGLVDPDAFAANTNLMPGQVLMLTKPLGTGILATAVKARWDGADAMEQALAATASKLNAGPAKAIRELGLRAATDITGFGLGGHLLEMAEASGVGIRLAASALPVLPYARDLAAEGLVPAGSYANRRFRRHDTQADPEVDPILMDIIFDPQTSGGIVLALDPTQVDGARAILAEHGDMGRVIGDVTAHPGGPRLHIV